MHQLTELSFVDEFDGFHPLATLFFFGACCKRGGRLYATTAPSRCIPASYCHLSAILQTISIIAANLQYNRAAFRIFIALLMFSFDSTLYKAHAPYYIAIAAWPVVHYISSLSYKGHNFRKKCIEH
jgi:hypothetical protein